MSFVSGRLLRRAARRKGQHMNTGSSDELTEQENAIQKAATQCQPPIANEIEMKIFRSGYRAALASSGAQPTGDEQRVEEIRADRVEAGDRVWWGERWNEVTRSGSWCGGTTLRLKVVKTGAVARPCVPSSLLFLRVARNAESSIPSPAEAAELLYYEHVEGNTCSCEHSTWCLFDAGFTAAKKASPSPAEVEAAAKLMAELQNGGKFPWEILEDPGRDLWRRNARAVLAAARAATQEDDNGH